MEQSRVISAVQRIADSLITASRLLPPDAAKALEEAVPEGGKAVSVLEAIRRNLAIARERDIPMCQDTGAFWCLAEIGRESRIPLSLAERVITEGCREAAEKGCYRTSIVSEPVYERKNTGTNLPPFINYELMDGDGLRLSFLMKGFGSENCSSVRMLNPTAGEDGVFRAVMEMLEAAGGKPCPPVFLGVGIGGTMDRAAFLSKKAFFFTDERYNELSARLLRGANELGTGPGGLGGSPTALGVSIAAEPTHIAGLPVALTVNCWAERKAAIEFREEELC